MLEKCEQKLFYSNSSSISKPSKSSNKASSKSTFSSDEMNLRSDSLRVEFCRNNSLPVNLSAFFLTSLPCNLFKSNSVFQAMKFSTVTLVPINFFVKMASAASFSARIRCSFNSSFCVWFNSNHSIAADITRNVITSPRFSSMVSCKVFFKSNLCQLIGIPIRISDFQGDCWTSFNFIHRSYVHRNNIIWGFFEHFHVVFINRHQCLNFFFDFFTHFCCKIIRKSLQIKSKIKFAFFLELYLHSRV